MTDEPSRFGLLLESPLSQAMWRLLVCAFLLYVSFCFVLIFTKSYSVLSMLVVSMIAGGAVLDRLRTGSIRVWNGVIEYSRQPFFYWIGIALLFSFLVFSFVVGEHL